MYLGQMSEVVKARELVAAFRARAAREGEAVSGYWTRLADQVEARLLARTGWEK